MIFAFVEEQKTNDSNSVNKVIFSLRFLSHLIADYFMVFRSKAHRNQNALSIQTCDKSAVVSRFNYHAK